MTRVTLWRGPGIVALALALPTAANGSVDDLDHVLERAQNRAQARLVGVQPLWPRHETWDDPWQITTDHFRVTQVRAAWMGRRLAHSLEQMWPFFEELLGPLEDTSIIPVDVHPDVPTYNAVGEALQANHSAHHSSFFSSFYGQEFPNRPVVTYDPRQEEVLIRQATHAVVHAYIDRCSGDEARLPPWLLEGLAGYFEMFWDQRFGDRHFAWFRERHSQGRLVALNRLVDFESDDWSHDSVKQAAMFVLFLESACEDTATLRDEHDEIVDEPFRDWLRELFANRSVEGHPVQQLLESECARIDREFRFWALAATAVGSRESDTEGDGASDEHDGGRRP